MTIKPYLLIASLLLLQACGSAQPRGSMLETPLNQQQIRQALNKQHQEWRGVKYKMGGTNRSGVDCSGFVYRTFRDKIQVGVPRSTELQSRIGTPVEKKHLKPGDLVFFKTGSVLKSRHVGIYVGRDQFLHASTSRGVMKSSLSNPYWKNAYWHSRRVLQ